MANFSGSRLRLFPQRVEPPCHGAGRLAILVLSAVLLASGAAGLPHLHVSASGQGTDLVLAEGSTLSVDVFASEIPAGSDANGLFGFGFRLQFDPQGVSSSSVILGPLWVAEGFSSSESTSGEVGLISNRFFQTGGPVGDDILLGTIEFTGQQVGIHTLAMTYFSGVGDNVLFDGTRLDTEAEGFFQSVSLQVIPEPSTSVLVTLGMLGLALRSRSRLGGRGGSSACERPWRAFGTPKQRHLRLSRSLPLVLLAWCVAPVDASATNHLTRIETLMSGANGDPRVQFIEIKFEDDSQNLWGPNESSESRARLRFFDASGMAVGTFEFPGNAPIGPVDPESAGHSALIATQEFVNLTGLPADFIFPPLIQGVDGMVCFEHNPANPAFPVRHCLAYGNYKGPEESDCVRSADSTPLNECCLNETFNGPPADALENAGPEPLSLNRIIDSANPGSDFECGHSNADFRLENPSPRSSSGQTSGVPALPLFEQGRAVFSRETFNGNGRSCIDCHLPSDDFGLEPASVFQTFALNPLAPLFVAEQAPALANLENPCLMRMGNQRALILENIDGFSNEPVFRGSPHLLNIASTAPFGLSGEFQNLRIFSEGAVRQHFPRTLARNADPLAGPVDFRLPTEFELEVVELFMSGIAFPSDGVLDLDRMIDFHVSENGADPLAIQRGRDLFFGEQAQCVRCHSGATLSDADGTLGTGVGNLDFNTGTVNVLENADDGCSGGPGDPVVALPQEAGGLRTFNTPELLGVARTPPFFHDGSAETLRDTVLFYDSAEFRASPAGQLMPTNIVLNFSEAQDIVAFLEAISVDPNPGSLPTCNDGIDNDGDGLIDLADGDCTGPADEESGSIGVGTPFLVDAGGLFSSNLFGIAASTISNPQPALLAVDAMGSIVGRTEPFDLTLMLSTGRFSAPLPSIGSSGSGAEIEVGGALGAGAQSEWAMTQISGVPGQTEVRYRFTPPELADPVGVGVLVMIREDALRMDSLHETLGFPGGKVAAAARFHDPEGTDLSTYSIETAESVQGVEISAQDFNAEVDLSGSGPIFASRKIVLTTAGICTGFPGGVLQVHGNCSQEDVFRLDRVNDRVIVEVSSAVLREFVSSAEDTLSVREGDRCDTGAILAEVSGPLAEGTADVSLVFPPPADLGLVFLLCLETLSNQAFSHSITVKASVEFGSVFMASVPAVESTWTLAPRCFGDFNGDRSVDNIDTFSFQSCFPCSGGSCDAACDFDLDGRVNNFDALAFHSLFGSVCEPITVGVERFQFAPEPRTWVVLALSIPLLGRLYRRRRDLLNEAIVEEKGSELRRDSTAR